MNEKQPKIECGKKTVTFTVEKTVRINVEEAIKDLKILNGLPPYNKFTNFCQNDGYFAKSLVDKYGMDISSIEKAVNFDNIRNEYQRLMDQFENFKG